MIDLFKLLAIETREDKYTFCLIEMIKSGNDDFRKKVGQHFGFADGNYNVIRNSFSGISSSSRKQVTPDFILYNDVRMAIVESKMFSDEGYKQTEDYANNSEVIKKYLNIPNANVELYFLTLSGKKAENERVKSLKWNEFYESILKDTSFNDPCLDLIRDTILEQATKFRAFENALSSKSYSELFNSDQYWVTPLSLFSSGKYDDVWQQMAGDEAFIIANFAVTGLGHSEFSTDLYKESWRLLGKGRFDNVHLFIRIAWNSERPTVWLGWESFDGDSENYKYVDKKNNLVPKEIRSVIVKSLLDYKEAWVTPHHLMNIKTSPRREDSIKALKCEIDSKGKTIVEIIEEIKTIIEYYSEEIKRVLSCFKIKNDSLSFDKDEYIHVIQKKTSEG